MIKNIIKIVLSVLVLALTYAPILSGGVSATIRATASVINPSGILLDENNFLYAVNSEHQKFASLNESFIETDYTFSSQLLVWHSTAEVSLTIQKENGHQLTQTLTQNKLINLFGNSANANNLTISLIELSQFFNNQTENNSSYTITLIDLNL